MTPAPDARSRPGHDLINAGWVDFGDRMIEVLGRSAPPAGDAPDRADRPHRRSGMLGALRRIAAWLAGGWRRDPRDDPWHDPTGGRGRRPTGSAPLPRTATEAATHLSILSCGGLRRG
ncbi:MAG TPA: hypothetical protein PKD10_10345 [Paracoccaceae bacterium]|nr:hypothetical protein [Paracoccaceae bacterium]HMO72218.1 hypothetical protein [Paracoccaceae bacterium]